MKKIIFVIGCSVIAFGAMAQDKNNPPTNDPKEQNQYQLPTLQQPAPNSGQDKTGQGQQLQTSGQYCAALRKGEVKVISGNKEITSDVKLASGVKIKTNGTVIKNDGSSTVLKDGQCVNREGNIIKSDKLENKDENRDLDEDLKDKNKSPNPDIQNKPMNK